MTKLQDFKNMINCAAEYIKAAKQELTDIDSKFGDADHGITMEKIANALQNTEGNTNIKSYLDDLTSAVLSINGGSAVPLWGTFLTGFSKSAPTEEISTEDLKIMFKCGLEELEDITTARVGDKTMMDALIPAVDAIQNAEGDIPEILKKGAIAAEAGAERSKEFVSKFGRAKSYKEQTIGTPDAGAVSMKCFFIGLYEGTKLSCKEDNNI